MGSARRNLTYLGDKITVKPYRRDLSGAITSSKNTSTSRCDQRMRCWLVSLELVNNCRDGRTTVLSGCSKSASGSPGSWEVNALFPPRLAPGTSYRVSSPSLCYLTIRARFSARIGIEAIIQMINTRGNWYETRCTCTFSSKLPQTFQFVKDVH
jgi:hypothetical protein